MLVALVPSLAFVGLAAKATSMRATRAAAGTRSGVASAWVGAESELRRGRADRPVRGEREWRATERRRVDAEEEVVHDRVANQRELEDLDPLDPGAHRERGDQPIECLAHGDRHLAGALRMSVDAVSVKGKTNEGMGEIGRGEGMAVHAVALLRHVDNPQSTTRNPQSS